MKTMLLIRHGETDANARELFRGRNDIPLSDAGRLQARELAKHLADRRVDRVFSSPLRRARETAELAFPEHEVVPEVLVNNLDLGALSGRPKEDVRVNDPEIWAQWVEAPEEIRFPGGETLGHVYGRVGRFLERAAAMPEETLAVVSHRSVLKVLLAAVVGVRERYYWRFHLDNCSITTLRLSPVIGFVIDGMNFTNHLSRFVTENA